MLWIYYMLVNECSRLFTFSQLWIVSALIVLYRHLSVLLLHILNTLAVVELLLIESSDKTFSSGIKAWILASITNVLCNFGKLIDLTIKLLWIRKHFSELLNSVSPP